MSQNFLLDEESALRAEGVNTVFTGTPSYGFIVAKILWSLMSFCSPFYFPANECLFMLVSRSTFPYFLFLLHSFQFSVLHKCFAPTSPPKILLACSRCILQRTSFHILRPFLPTSFPSCTSQMFYPKLSLPKSSWACSRSLLQRTSFPFPLPFPPVLCCHGDFFIIVFYIGHVGLMRFYDCFFFYCTCNAFLFF